MIYKTLRRKLNIEKHQQQYRPRVNSGAPTPFILPLLQTRSGAVIETRKHKLIKWWYKILIGIISPNFSSYNGGHGRDRIVVGLITTYAISAYHLKHCEFESRSGKVYSIHHYVIKFVIDIRQVSGILRVLWFPPPSKLTATI